MDTSTPVYAGETEWLDDDVANEFDGNIAYGLPDLPSDNEIVPDEDQAVLISIREQQTLDCFRIGDIANRLVERAIERWVQSQDKNQKRVTADRVRAAVGRFCGKSGRTVRYYSEAADFYGLETRSHYEILPFSHFVFARSMGDNWRDVLEYSTMHPGATLSELRRVFIESDTPSPVTELFGASIVKDQDFPPTETVITPGVNVANIRSISAESPLDSGPAADFIARGMAGITRISPQLKVNVFGDLLTALDRAGEFVAQNVKDKDARAEFAAESASMRLAIARTLESIG